jgi:hypothetical protein
MSQDQQYTLKVNQDEALLEIKAQSEITFTALLASQEETERLAEEQGIRKVLIDARQMQAAPSLPEFVSFGQGLSGSPLLRSLRYALVGSLVSGFQLQLLRSATRRLGFEVNLFKDRAEALRWLHAED